MGDTEEKTLYISNLDKNVDEEILYELFLQAGPIERVNIPPNKDYGFVSYKHDSSVDYAIKLLRGTRLFRRELQIQKRRAERANNQQMNFQNMNFQMMNQGFFLNNNGQPDFNQYLAFGANMIMPMNMNMMNLMNLQNMNVQNVSNNSPNQRNDNLSQSALRGQYSNRNRPYDRDSRNYGPRQRENRNRRDQQGRSNRKGRY